MGSLLKRSQVIACAAILLSLVRSADMPAATDGPNLAVNPDFESLGPGGIPSGWSTWQRADGAVFRVISDAKTAHSGKTCVAIKQTAASPHNYAVWVQTIPAKANAIYRYSFWIKTEDVRPLTPYTMDGPTVAGDVGFLDANRKNLAFEGPSLRSSNVLMTHDWTRFELSARAPTQTAFIKINLNLANAVGTVYFDSVSLVESSFKKVESPDWLADAIVYEAGPWEYARYGDGNAFAGLRQKLPEMKDLGINTLYLQPIWENRGGYAITDHYAIYRSYGTESDLKGLVAEAHSLGIRVILDLAGTIGVPLQSRLVGEHRDWFILSGDKGGDNRGDNALYTAWVNLLGLDTNLNAVQDYFAEFARYYVERVGVDGYRCDAASASPPQLFARIRAAIHAVKPDAIMIAEEHAPFDFETAFDATYDFTFMKFLTSIAANPRVAARSVSEMERERSLFPPGALQFRYFEHPGFDYTVASSCSTDCALAFGALLLTADGVPKIYNGQEVGNTESQKGSWLPLLNWDVNPDAARYRAAYKALAGLRSSHAVLRRGELKALRASDDRIAAFARTLGGEQPIITVINFSNSPIEPRLDLSAGLSKVKEKLTLVDLLDHTQFPVSDTKAFTLKLAPFKARVLLVSSDGR
jgi:glycosidase